MHTSMFIQRKLVHFPGYNSQRRNKVLIDTRGMHNTLNIIHPRQLQKKGVHRYQRLLEVCAKVHVDLLTRIRS